MPIDDEDDVASTRTSDIRDTTSYLGAASSFAGGISALGGAYVQSQATRAQAAYQAKMADINHQLADWEANSAYNRGNVAANQTLSRSNLIVGQERAGLAASGVDVNSGDAARLQARTQAVSALDALTIANNATREAFGYRISAINASAQSQFMQSAASAQSTNTLVSGGLNSLAFGLKGLSRLPSSSDPDLTRYTFNASSNYTMPDFGAEANNPEPSLLGGQSLTGD